MGRDFEDSVRVRECVGKCGSQKVGKCMNVK
jgi:hypothetical protein